MESNVIDRHYKPLEEMDVIDDFLFTEIMSDEKKGKELCRMIISTVLGREVGEISFTPQKIIPGISERSHGIRMDVYVIEKKEENDGKRPDINVYDVEPDKRVSHREGLPKRSRYYGDLIDVQVMKSGIDYELLPDLVMIFILSYDPFGENAMYYEVGNIIKTHPNIPYYDGIRRIFLFVDGELPEGAGEEKKQLKNLLNYIGHSTEANVTDQNTKKLDDIVRSMKADEETEGRRMKSWDIERDIREESREEGRAEAYTDALLNSIRKLMKNMKLSAQQAMDTLEIPESEQATYRAML